MSALSVTDTIRPTAPTDLTSRPTLVVAHRGASAYAPENTLTAIRQAVELRADMVEVDVRRTRDGALVLLHDTDLDRTTDAAEVLRRRSSRAVADLTYAEVLGLDAGSWFSPAYAGEPVPTLEQALDLLALSDTGLLLEVKKPGLYPGIMADIAATLRSRPAYVQRAAEADRLCVQSFDHRAMHDFARLQTGVPVGVLGHPTLRRLPRLGRWADQVNPHHRQATPAYVEAVQAEGMDCLAWTADRPSDIARLVASGVDGIISNRPDEVRRVLDRRLVAV